MKDKIVWIILGLFFINFMWNFLKEDVKNFDYLRSEYNKLQDELKDLNTKLIKQDDKIFRIQREMVQSDSIIDGATRIELDSLFDVFFSTVR